MTSLLRCSPLILRPDYKLLIMRPDIEYLCRQLLRLCVT